MYFMIFFANCLFIGFIKKIYNYVLNILIIICIYFKKHLFCVFIYVLLY